ncbi:unnamed protein product [Diabrotica balteata]|uniref:Uncharacterized protein n=1 Tax=Diabrotica balteata TaxID=107213 RepID=A0A9P0E0W0_DIABA|nr:unnamed protein product [Diabrotica balteata]
MKVCLIVSLVLCLSCISLAVEVKHKSSHSAAQGHGHDDKGGQVVVKKHGSSSGKSSKHDEAHANKGQELQDLHKTSHLEKGGKKTSHNEEGGHQSAKHSSGGSHHGLKYQEGKKHKKANYLKGFREKYHKDESNKHDSFFSNGEKSGEFEIFGKKNSKYSSESFAKKKGKNHKNASSAKTGGKAYKSGKTHHDSDAKAHKGQGGFEKHHKSADKYAKKHASHGGKKYKVHSV